MVVLFFLFQDVMIAQSVTIRGTAVGAEGRTIIVTVPADLISNLDTTLGSAKVDALGNFELSFPVEHIVYAKLSIDFHEGMLYLEPGGQYQVKISVPAPVQRTDVNILLESQNLGIDWPSADPGELNQVIRKFNTLYNKFILVNYNALYRDRKRALVDTFRLRCQREFREVKDPFFLTMVKYRTASLEQLAQVVGPAQIARKYLLDEPILYTHPEYMEFFSQFYSKYLTATCRAVKFTDYNAILGKAGSYPAMMLALQKDTLVHKTQLRELILLRNLQEMFYDPQFKPDQILALLQSIRRESRFPEHRIIAADMITLLTKLRMGTSAPDFSLTDRDRKTVTLAGLKGKPVVLTFWTTYCQECLSEMEVMRTTWQSYKEKVEFVSISLDKDFLKMVYFLNLKKDFGWTFLHLGDRVDLLKAYDIRTFPMYVLIDAQGRIARYPLDVPGPGMEAALNSLLNP